jgi:Trk-type K+ transport system membrane component
MFTLLVIYIVGVNFSLLFSRYINKKYKRGHDLYLDANSVSLVLLSWIFALLLLIFILDIYWMNSIARVIIIKKFKDWFE